MAFTRGWDNTTPPGTRDADEIDDIIRELKVDISERLLSKLFIALPNTTVEGDIVVKGEILGSAGGKIMVVHGNNFPHDSADGATYDGFGITVLGTATGIRCPLQLPPGATILKVRWLVTGNSTATMTLRLRSLAFAVGLTEATLDTQTHALATTVIKDSGIISVPIENNKAYFLDANLAGLITQTMTIHAVEITYTVPNCQVTL